LHHSPVQLDVGRLADAARARCAPDATAGFMVYDRSRSNADMPPESLRNQRAVNIVVQHRF